MTRSAGKQICVNSRPDTDVCQCLTPMFELSPFYIFHRRKIHGTSALCGIFFWRGCEIEKIFWYYLRWKDIFHAIQITWAHENRELTGCKEPIEI